MSTDRRSDPARVAGPPLSKGEADDTANVRFPVDFSSLSDTSRYLPSENRPGEADSTAIRPAASDTKLARPFGAPQDDSNALSANAWAVASTTAVVTSPVLATGEGHNSARDAKSPASSDSRPSEPQATLKMVGNIGAAETVETVSGGASEPPFDEPRETEGGSSDTADDRRTSETLEVFDTALAGRRDQGDGADLAEAQHSESAAVGAGERQDEVAVGETAPRRQPARPPAQYRPKLGQAARTESRGPSSAPSRNQQAMDAEFLLSFNPGGWGLDITALLRRPSGSPEQLEISDGGGPVVLSSIDETMLEPFPIDDLAASLADGFAAETLGGERLRWVRTGRRLHVFSERSGVPGFATVPRLIIGQDNVVLCTREFAPIAIQQIIATGSPRPSEVSGPGVPTGWVCWKGIRPAHPHTPAVADELLSALDPRPDAAIELAGGITSARGQWIEGRAPAIRIAGTPPAPGEVTIDGATAVVSDDGGWTATGWDDEGVHQVEYLSIRRSYTIVRATGSWSWWPAHGSAVELAGALGSALGRTPALILADPSLWLLGARPGEVSRAIRQPGAPGAYAAPSFEPIWAVARKSGRRRPRPSLVGMAVPPQPPAQRMPADSIRAWSKIIRDAAVPDTSPDNEQTAIWRQFVVAARSVRRLRR